MEVQPPRQWTKLSPDKHRQTPAAEPGGDVVRKLREEERIRAGTEKEIAPMDAWADVPGWKKLLSELEVRADR